MEVVKSGHSYLLDNLKNQGLTALKFYMDPELHEGEAQEGPSTQEVLRACIERVQSLDKEKPWAGNSVIVYHLRKALVGFEIRALERAVDKDEPVELWTANKRGHIFND